MKNKVISLILSLLMIFCFAGCTSNTDKVNTDSVLPTLTVSSDYITSSYNEESSSEVIINIPSEAETVSKEEAIEESSAEETTEEEVMVWIPRTGKRYHNNYKCSNMIDPDYVSITYATEYGYTPCKNCYYN